MLRLELTVLFANELRLIPVCIKASVSFHDRVTLPQCKTQALEKLKLLVPFDVN